MQRAMVAERAVSWNVGTKMPTNRPRIGRSRSSFKGAVFKSSAAEQSDEDIPPNCMRYKIAIPKPVGLVLEEKSNGDIKVAEIVPGGNADKTNQVSVGDMLIATSGLTRTTEQFYGDVAVRGGETMVRMLVRGQTFNTVMAAIGSHLAGMNVTLEFQRCEDE